MSKKILIIDDDQTGVAVMRGCLTRAGYEVINAPNGVIGLEIAQSAQPALIVLDIEMPEMNGYSFMTAFKKTAVGGITPVVVSTSHEENKALFNRFGIKEFLVKPVNVNRLVEKIQAIIGQA